MYNNRIGFIKTKSEGVALRVIDGLKSKPLRGSIPDLRIAKERKLDSLSQGLRQERDNNKISSPCKKDLEPKEDISRSFKDCKDRNDKLKSDDGRHDTKEGKISKNTPIKGTYDAEDSVELQPYNERC